MTKEHTKLEQVTLVLKNYLEGKLKDTEQPMYSFRPKELVQYLKDKHPEYKGLEKGLVQKVIKSSDTMLKTSHGVYSYTTKKLPDVETVLSLVKELQAKLELANTCATSDNPVLLTKELRRTIYLYEYTKDKVDKLVEKLNNEYK